jgi:hypothetical protein
MKIPIVCEAETEINTDEDEEPERREKKGR